MKRYFNIKSVYGVETVEELNRNDFNSYKDFRKELNKLKTEYIISGMNVYVSQRSDKTWNTK